MPSLALAALGSPQVILIVCVALPFTSTFTHRAASFAVASQNSISNGRAVPSMVAKRMSSPFGLAVAKSKLVASSTIATGYLGTSPITAAPAAVVSSLIIFALLPLEGGGPSLPLFPSGEPDPPAPPLPPEPPPPEPPLLELPPLPPLALEPPLPPLVLLPPEPPLVEPPVEPPDPAVLPPLPPVRDPPLPPLPPVALLPPLPPWLPPFSDWGQAAARVIVKTIPARSRRDCFRMAGTYRHDAFASKRYRDFRRKWPRD